MNRNNLIGLMEKEAGLPWDVLVIGGGATGLGVALDAVTRGYKTLLFEKSDFTKGTSSRSTKLVHGGVRYLAQGDIFLVMEALAERGRMLKNAPHLTTNQEFIIPVYTWFDVILYTAGLKFYDILAGRLGLGKSYFIGREKTLERLPNLKPEGLKGGIVYHDGQFDDSRMAIAIACSCVNNGGIVLNYFNVTGLLKDERGKVKGVKATDRISGKEYDLRAGVVVNATGVFADGILRLDNPSAHHIIKPSQGVHIVLDGSFLQGSSAIMIPKTDDGRVLFAIPWYGKVVAGTTDTPLDTISDEPVALDEEISFILHTAAKYLVRAPEKEDILSVFAGLRPLASDPDNPRSTKEISRRHKIILSGSGLITVTGGKWTTYRCMAQETVDKAIKAGLLEKRECVTKTFNLDSGNHKYAGDRLKIYGEGAEEIDNMTGKNPGMGNKITDPLPYTKAEIVWICRNEMPVSIEDVLSRRTRALFLDARESEKIAPEVASIMADELGFDGDWKADELEKFSTLVRNYVR
jgi:glycerol-3-phosphate dehydrogenase